MFGRLLSDQESSRTISANVTSTVYHGKVVDISDPTNSKRIRVRIVGIDDLLTDDSLPWAMSAMPNFFYCLPQVGEHVLIIMMNPWNKTYTRIYMGPLQTENFGEQPYTDSMAKFGFTVLEDEK
jgi:phage baseplate assembly protein gpV